MDVVSERWPFGRTAAEVWDAAMVEDAGVWLRRWG